MGRLLARRFRDQLTKEILGLPPVLRSLAFITGGLHELEKEKDPTQRGQQKEDQQRDADVDRCKGHPNVLAPSSFVVGRIVVSPPPIGEQHGQVDESQDSSAEREPAEGIRSLGIVHGIRNAVAQPWPDENRRNSSPPTLFRCQLLI